VSSQALLTDLANAGLFASAALTTAAVAAYATRARGQDGLMPWWRSPFGLHLMCFMAAFAIVLDEDALYVLGLYAGAAPLQAQWYAWVRAISFLALIPPVLAWRLWIIMRPPGRRRT
jgi:hypothetical protein